MKNVREALDSGTDPRTWVQNKTGIDMQTIQQAELQLVSGGEVGATGMGDDYHYTGQGGNDYGSTLADCMGAFGGIDGGSAISCMWIIWDYLSH